MNERLNEWINSSLYSHKIGYINSIVLFLIFFFLRTKVKTERFSLCTISYSLCIPFTMETESLGTTDPGLDVHQWECTNERYLCKIWKEEEKREHEILQWSLGICPKFTCYGLQRAVVITAVSCSSYSFLTLWKVALDLRTGLVYLHFCSSRPFSSCVTTEIPVLNALLPKILRVMSVFLTEAKLNIFFLSEQKNFSRNLPSDIYSHLIG